MLNPDALKTLSLYPKNSLIGLLVDGHFLESDPLAWVKYEEREPGCISSGFEAFAFILNTMDRKLDASYIKSIHAKFALFHLTHGKTEKYITPGKFRNGSASFSLSCKRVTLNGIKELLISIQSGILGEWGAKVSNLDNGKEYSKDTLKNQIIDTEFVETIYNNIHNIKQHKYYAPQLSILELEDAVEKLIQQFHSKMQDATNDDQKLAQIAWLIYILEHVHPFPDINTRTFVLGLSLRLLLEYGLIPATFTDLNRFDGYSQEELVDELKKAMQKTQKIIKDTSSEFDFNTNKELSSQYEYHVYPWIEALDTLRNPKEIHQSSLLTTQSFFTIEVEEEIPELEETSTPIEKLKTPIKTTSHNDPFFLNLDIPEDPAFKELLTDIDKSPTDLFNFLI